MQRQSRAGRRVCREAHGAQRARKENKRKDKPARGRRQAALGRRPPARGTHVLGVALVHRGQWSPSGHFPSLGHQRCPRRALALAHHPRAGPGRASAGRRRVQRATMKDEVPGGGVAPCPPASAAALDPPEGAGRPLALRLQRAHPTLSRAGRGAQRRRLIGR